MMRSAGALLVALAVAAGCATFNAAQKPMLPPSSDMPIAKAQKLIREKKYADAIAALEQMLREDLSPSQAAEAKYLIATVYVAADNPRRDYARALTEFDEFLRRYPDDEKAPEAKSWKTAIKTILDTRKENENLHKKIEGLKQLDVRQEEKRLGK
jgi:outer membrane protein assembly factor BamD (BamD/ComL family)